MKLVALLLLPALAHADPTSSAAWSELSVTRLAQGRVDEARMAASQALASARSQVEIGQAQYNLGRVEEKSSHFTAAVAAYEASIAARPNETVQQRLELLQIAGLDKPVVIAPLAGPFSSLEDAQARQRTELANDPDSGLGPRDRFVCPTRSERVIRAAHAPFARAIEYTCFIARRGDRPVVGVTRSLAVDTGHGWFMTELYNLDGGVGHVPTYEVTLTSDVVEGRSLDGATVLVSRISGEAERHGSYANSYVRVIGIGPSGIPRKLELWVASSYDGKGQTCADGVTHLEDDVCIDGNDAKLAWKLDGEALVVTRRTATVYGGLAGHPVRHVRTFDTDERYSLRFP